MPMRKKSTLRLLIMFFVMHTSKIIICLDILLLLETTVFSTTLQVSESEVIVV